MSQKKLNALTARIEKIEKTLAKLLGSARTAKPHEAEAPPSLLAALL